MTQKTWDEKYTSACDPAREPSSFLKEHIHSLTQGKALDLAMGNGRNALFLAMHGYEVDALDYSKVAVDKVRSFVQKKSLPVHVKQADLTDYQLPENTYDVIINFYFLERTLVPRIKKGLTKGGMLLFETYTTEQSHYGRPHNPDYLLQPNELLHSFIDLHIIYYHERVVKSPQGTKAIASLLAQKG
jgi:SAM-dependent methyltransferase